MKDWTREVYHLLSLCLVLKPIFEANPVGDLENIPTRIPHLETLHTSFISHPTQPHNCILPFISQSVFVLFSPCSLSLSLSPCKVHLRWTETVTKTKTLTDDVQPFLEARGKEKRDFKIRTHRVTDKILQSASLNELCYQIKPLVLVQNPNELQNVWMIKTSHHFYLEKRRRER